MVCTDEPTFDCHWYDKLVPVAVTLNVAVSPAVTVLFAGCTVIDGATAALVTVSVAVALFVLPVELLTTTSNVAPFCDIVVDEIVYDAEVAPPIFDPPCCH